MLDMAHQFVGPMPIEDFLAVFMHSRATTVSESGKTKAEPSYTEPSLPEKWQERFRAKSITKRYFASDFISAVKRAKICSSLFLVTATSKNDCESAHAPYLIGYRRPYHGSPATNFKGMELLIDCQKSSDDPFEDPGPDEDPLEHSFERQATYTSEDTRNQIISHTADQFASQSRCFAFSILLLDQYVRLIRWDHAGAIVTERLDWKKNPQPLVRFLWLFDHLSDAERGYDTSISDPTPAEIELTKKKLDERAKALASAKGENEQLAETRYSIDDSFRKFCVVDDDPETKECEARARYFVASVPQWQGGSPVGRGTKGYEALDLETGELVYLKDTWRYDEDLMEKEGDTYRKLAANGVSHIPRLACAGDVEEHRTRTHDFADEDWCCGEPILRRHRHYRLVLKDLGRPLSEFNSTKELCQVLLEAIIAHMEAYKAHILHQDISGGNILITDEGHALLIDWEMSKAVNGEKSSEQGRRTGTWQFLSVAILQEPRKAHELRDDLESFLYVLLYYSVCYQRNNLKYFPRNATRFFNDSCREANQTLGGMYKIRWFYHHLYPSDFATDELQKFLSKPHAALIERLRLLFFPLYARNITLEEMNPKPDPVAAAQILESSNCFVDIFREQLEKDGWKVGDRSFDMLANPVPFNAIARKFAFVSKTSSVLKRTSQAAGLDESFTKCKRQKV